MPPPTATLAASHAAGLAMGLRSRLPRHATARTPFRPAPRRHRPRPAPMSQVETPEQLAALLWAVGQHRDRGAFARLFAYYAPRLKAYFLRLGGSAALAEDLAQEAMLHLWRKAPQFDPARGNASAWVFTLARNLRLDALRRDRLGPASDEMPHLADEGPDPEAQAISGQAGAQLRQVLHELPEPQRQVVLLAYFNNRPHSAIERELGIPLGTVKGRLRLALARLRAAMETGA